MRVLHARDPKTEDVLRLQCHLLLHANFHGPLTILTATSPKNPEIRWICALRMCDPKTDDVILLATPITSFMPIFMAL